MSDFIQSVDDLIPIPQQQQQQGVEIISSEQELNKLKIIEQQQQELNNQHITINGAYNNNNNSYNYITNSHNLKVNETEAVDEFLKRQNWPNSDAKNWNLAVKFLMARKFNVDRAIELYQSHDNLRRKENLDLINISDNAFIKDLESGKFTILPFLKDYPVCALFTVRLHIPNSISELTTLRTLVYQLDAALENPDAQRNGIIFIYDMNNCKRANYDLSLSQKILTLIRGSYPARLNKLYIVSAPFWFKCLVKVLSVLMREKLRDRVLFVTNDELKVMVAPEILPDTLGGKVKLDHKEWLKECNKLITNKSSTCYYYYCTTSNNNNNNSSSRHNSNISNSSTSKDTASLINSSSNNNNNNNNSTNVRKRPSSDFIESEDNRQKVFVPSKQPPKKSISQISKASSISTNGHSISHDEIEINLEDGSIHQPTDDGMNIDQLVEHIKTQKVVGLLDEYKHIRTIPLSSSYNAFKSNINCQKNRYMDVVCLDDTRVVLKELKGCDDDECESDYIHANYVDGYKQKNAYISTQGPLDDTIEDFWSMVWQESTVVIVMTTKVKEQRKTKCAQYWPLEKNEIMKLTLFDVENVEIDAKDDYVVTTLKMKHNKTGDVRTIAHCQFISWPDHGVPESASEMLNFLNIVRHNQANLVQELTNNKKWSGHPLGPPMIVHCSAGIGRTGTFCTIDISINRLLDIKTVNVKDTVTKIRSQRAFSVQMPDQYVFCYLALIEYALQEGLINESDFSISDYFANE